MGKDYTQKLGKVIQIDEAQIQDHLGELVRGTVKEKKSYEMHDYYSNV